MRRPIILALILARCGSRRLSNKNILPLGGRPLIVHTLDALARSSFDGPVLVSTDDPRIAEVANAAGAKVPFLRDPEFARDVTTSGEAAIAALDQWIVAGGVAPTHVLLLQPTSPLRRAQTINRAIDTPMEHAGSLVGMTRLHVSADFVFDQRGHRVAPAASGPVLVPNGAIYLTSVDLLRATRGFYGEPVLPLELPADEAIDIDTADDFALAAAILASRNSQGPETMIDDIHG